MFRRHLANFAHSRSIRLERAAAGLRGDAKAIMLDRSLLWTYREHYLTGLMDWPTYSSNAYLLRRMIRHRRRVGSKQPFPL
jgi:hypothetical protein